MGRTSGRRIVATVLGAVCVLSLLPATRAAAAPAVLDCVEVMSVSELQGLLDDAGRDDATGEQLPLTADGLTVVRGTKPQPFTASILGVFYGAAGIDRDVIIAELSGLNIETTRGVWAGMSGSPVYVGDKLVGAVAYALSASGSAIAGITPAAEMMAMSGAATTAPAPALRLSTEDRYTVAAQTNSTVVSVPARIPPMQVPLAVNVAGPRLNWLRQQAVEDGSPMIPVAGGGSVTTAASGTAADIVAGSNIAASLSYGDISMAGTGTTTRTCGDDVLAFGHPFGWVGRTSLGLHTADSMAIISDPLNGAYKMATLGAPVGTIDHDGAVGLHGLLNTVAPSALISSSTAIEQADGTYVTDTGTTTVTDRTSAPFIAFLHGMSNIDFKLPAYGSGGSAKVTWITDLRHRGTDYRLRRTNQYSTPYGLSEESMVEGWSQLEDLAYSQFGRVTVKSVRLATTASQIRRELRIAKVQVRRDGRWITPRRPLAVRPGQTLRVRTVLHRYRDDTRVAIHTPRMVFEIPKRAAGGAGEIAVGQSFFEEDFGEEWMVTDSPEEEFCFPEGMCGSEQVPAETFGELLAQLRRAPRNDQLRATMTLESRTGMVIRKRMLQRANAVVGGATLSVRVIRP